MKVTEYGRYFFTVTSETRERLLHFVDFEPQIDEQGKIIPESAPKCSCEAWGFNVTRPHCKHVWACFDYLIPILEHLGKWRTPEPKPSSTKKRRYILK